MAKKTTDKTGPKKAGRTEKIKSMKDKIKKEAKVERRNKKGKDILKATGETWRLIHDGKHVVSLIKGDAFSETVTPHTVFIGTEAQCLAEIGRLNLLAHKQKNES